MKLLRTYRATLGTQELVNWDEVTSLQVTYDPTFKATALMIRTSDGKGHLTPKFNSKDADKVVANIGPYVEAMCEKHGIASVADGLDDVIAFGEASGS